MAVVVLGAAVAAWWLWPEGEVRQDAASTKKGLIKEVTPAAAPKPVEKTPAEKMRERYPELQIPDDWTKPYPPPAYREDGSLKRHSRYVSVYTNKISRSQMSLAAQTFPNRAERDIALVLSVHPGGTLVGDYKFGKKFVDAFLESLKEPILYDKDDTEAQRAMKDCVKEAKAELKAAYDRGEDIAEIMNETRRQYRELALYKSEIRKLVATTKREAKEGGKELSEQDRKDLISAANRMLKDRGCEPLGLPETFADQAFKETEIETGENKE